MWFVNKVYLWGRSVIRLNERDILLVSYPKTGSTWIRYYLYVLLMQKSGESKMTIDAMNGSMPEFANPSFFMNWQFSECHRIVKTHQKYLTLFSKNKGVLIVRDPRDIVISYYYYVLGLKAHGFKGSISDLLRDRKMGLKPFFQHYASWQTHVGLILRYEDLKENPIEGFSRLAAFYGIERSQEEILQAIDASNFSNMRTAQEKSSQLKSEFKEGHQFVRSGKKEQWKSLFSDDDRMYYESLKKEYKFDLYD